MGSAYKRCSLSAACPAADKRGEGIGLAKLQVGGWERALPSASMSFGAPHDLGCHTTSCPAVSHAGTSFKNY